MSYLDVPRLHFFGTFTANPSTRNNTPTNYTLPNPPPPPGGDGGANWNPDGSHAWAFVECTVQTVSGPDGSSIQDPLVGTAVSSAATPPTNPECGEPSTPKLVDLDTEQQMVSMIFGLQIQVGDSASGWVRGDFQPQPFNDINLQAPCAYYQSVLQGLTWSPDLASPVLQKLQKISPEALSIKFVVQQTPNTPLGKPAKGSITGTIGPASPGEPPNFLLGRLMRPTVPSSELAVSGHVPPQMLSDSQTPDLNYTPFVVDGNRGKVIVDFGNSQTVGQGTLQVAIFPSQGSPQILGTVDNTEAAYQATAAIQEFDVTTDQISLLQGSILGVLSQGSQILAEDENATSLALTPMVCRLNPGESVQIDLVALSFGAPAANQSVGIKIYNDMLQPVSGVPVGIPESALLVTGEDGVARPLGQPSSVTTDANGRASFTLTAAPEGPNNPRGIINGQKSYLDGQVYGVGFEWQLEPNPDPNVFVSVHVYDLLFPVPESPDWENDVLPILLPYEDLYPYMASLINLTDPGAVLKNAKEITCRLQLPDTDPRKMPVTRDLSANKRQTVLNWLAQQTQGGQGGKAGG